ncbi:type II toxin-antitoxin system RelE/ParE family toxin [Desulfobulbus elongatus]|uniref:type II toxin-antitoxin system RelE/ParE family toxin n=1 Tax=Desulfobulbus elongatus TaxID=53332 RepID=UPI0004871791|nr:type II toxin-antitoxin system RelE/ParE family toxin [Desulfobulbus elongatus]
MEYEIEKTQIFDEWLQNLRDRQAVLAIANRLTRVAAGNFGDHRSLEKGVSELRFFIGPGYRIYYAIRQARIVLLLGGGDKTSQKADLRRAIATLRNLEE